MKKIIAQPKTNVKLRGFTLIEILVAISILVLLMAITMAAWKGLSSGDSVKMAAESIKAQLHGARDRATFYSRNTGVRLVKDSTDPRIVRSLIYILQPQPYDTGSVTIERDPSHNNEWRIARGIGTNWYALLQQGMIQPGKTYIILNNGPFTFLTDSLTPGNETLILTKQYPGGPGTDPITLPEYSINVHPVVMPNQEPINLPRGVAIDLGSSIVPMNWEITDAAGNVTGYIDEMDIVFSPRGDVQRGLTGIPGQKVLTDSVIQSGRITLVLADIEDITLGNGVEVVDRKGPQHLVCIQAGNAKVYSSPVSTTDANGNGRADDPFEYAETGELASF